MKRTNDQSKRLFAIMRKLGIDDEARAELVFSTTNGRTKSSADLTYNEANSLIDKLNSYTGSARYYKFVTAMESLEGDAMRKKIIAMAHTLGWQQMNPVTLKMRADMDRINGWCVSKGQFKKPLNKHSIKELSALVSQFELMYNSEMKKKHG